MDSHQPNRGRIADVDMEDEVEDVMKDKENKEDMGEDKDAPSHPGSVAMDLPPTLTGKEEPVNVRMEDEQSVLSLSVLLISNNIHISNTYLNLSFLFTLKKIDWWQFVAWVT